MLPISNSGKYFEIKGTLMHICKSPYTGFPKWGRLVGGDNLGKMAKNGMKITKSAFLVGGGGGQANFWDSGGDNPQSPPLGKTLLYVCIHIKIKPGKFRILNPRNSRVIHRKVCEMFIYKHKQ